MKRFFIAGLLFVALMLPTPVHAARTSPLIIDHTKVQEFNALILPQNSSWLEAAKNLNRATYWHTSHGSQIPGGMSYLKTAYPANSLNFISDSLYYEYGGSNQKAPLGTLSLWDWGSTDLGNGSWSTITQTMLDNQLPGGGTYAIPDSRNLVMWSWCGQMSTNSLDQVNAYLNQMTNFETSGYPYYPNVNFVYMTGHLDGTGVNGTLYRNNNQVRNYASTNNKILFDFADIESFDPAGNYYPNESDACTWCTSWCASHPTECQNLPGCAHSHGFNCVQKGKAFWVMLAYLSGWPGPSGNPTGGPTPTLLPTPTGLPGDADADADVDHFDLLTLLQSFGRQLTTIVDWNRSGNVDIYDFNVVIAKLLP